LRKFAKIKNTGDEVLSNARNFDTCYIVHTTLSSALCTLVKSMESFERIYREIFTAIPVAYVNNRFNNN
jgi:hypothetical protein